MPDVTDGTHLVRVDRAHEASLHKALSLEGNRVFINPTKDNARRINWMQDLSPDDRRELRNVLSQGDPLPPKFLVALAERVHPDLEDAWTRVGNDSWEFTDDIDDQLSTQPARYLYRVRLQERNAGLSPEAVYLHKVFEVPAQRRPATPRLHQPVGTPDGPRVPLEMQNLAGVAAVHVFTAVQPWDPDPEDQKPGGKLLRIRNRPDLYPDGLRLRLSTGEIVAPQSLPLEAPAVQDGRGRWEVEIDAPEGSLVSVWSAAVTTEGTASSLVGPVRVVLPRTLGGA
jgi:hypothetical protein